MTSGAAHGPGIYLATESWAQLAGFFCFLFTPTYCNHLKDDNLEVFSAFFWIVIFERNSGQPES